MQHWGSKHPFSESLAGRYVKTASKPISLLLVEDSHVQRDLLKVTLNEFNIAVDEASDLESAISWVDFGGHDIALVDIRIPLASDGIEVIARLRAKNSTIPICVYSGDLSGDVIARAVAVGGVITFAPKMFLDASYLEQLFAMFNFSARASKDRSR